MSEHMRQLRTLLEGIEDLPDFDKVDQEKLERNILRDIKRRQPVSQQWINEAMKKWHVERRPAVPSRYDSVTVTYEWLRKDPLMRDPEEPEYYVEVELEIAGRHIASRSSSSYDPGNVEGYEDAYVNDITLTDSPHKNDLPLTWPEKALIDHEVSQQRGWLEDQLSSYSNN